MEFIEFKDIKEKVLHDVLENGLEVYIMRKKDFNSYEARFFTDFGGLDTEFIPINKNKMVKMPTGIAHFLEHKLFEQENGESAHEFYKNSGTTVNAFTNYKKTCYYISGINDFKKNLIYLLDFVQSPYFTDKNVEKEKGIIIQEALMNLDDPDRKFYEKISENLFKEIPYNISIVGTLDDIKSITKEHLYTCYNTFYHPSNMKLIVVSNEDEKKVLNLVKENQKNKKFEKNLKIRKKEFLEPKEVNKKYEVLEKEISQKRLCYSIKIPKSSINAEKIEIYDSFVILLCYLIGSLSNFNLKLKQDGIIVGNISFSVNFEENRNEYVIINIYAVTNKEKEFISLLEKQLKIKSCTEKEFNNFKKIIISSIYYNLNTVEGTMRFLYNEYTCSNKIDSNNLKLEKNLDYDKFLSIIKELKIENKSVVVIKPKDS